ncbi:SAM-dependent methyltransferase [Citrobacter amalonaticus]|uniref:SAM-dependent methyltransferase n=1 Tax=Citrobacter amalonaticus TaxID=35703 RepID=UPI00255B01CF|nr:SAM-dependent methyltransferase [Citrobacter amalonaticus]MDL4616495.1 SAM-dependent methyltransferase [Citrobacter amalonaticus]MDL4620593.1 SAM-dependent methyltransferase [Citrobacter amalonaticus]
MYEQDPLSALDAITEAQRIAFAPMLFQTALCLRNADVLAYLDRQGKQGATLEDITENSHVNEYAVSVLLDMGLSGRIITHKAGRYYLAKIGHFLLHDTMTRVNMDFTHDVCYQGLFFLENALKEGKPSGLKVFGDWPTIYPALSQLPPSARESWFAFDHYYSDGAFDAALPHVFASCPATLYDIWWMSQFLDCFSPEQIVAMLSKVARVMKPGARLCIMELFWDAQRFEAASFSLNASSLYFTCMANGNSRFYSAEKFYGYLDKAGFQVDERHDDLGVGHTLLICQKKK